MYIINIVALKYSVEFFSFSVYTDKCVETTLGNNGKGLISVCLINIMLDKFQHLL